MILAYPDGGGNHFLVWRPAHCGHQAARRDASFTITLAAFFDFAVSIVIPALPIAAGPDKQANLGSSSEQRRLAERLIEVDSKPIEKAPPASRSDEERAGIALPLQPSEFETAAAYFRADVAGDMKAPLAPVETRAAKYSPGSRPRSQDRAKIHKKCGAGIRDLSSVIGQRDASTGGEGIRDRDSDTSGQMIETSACEAQCVVACRARMISWRNFDGLPPP